MLRLKSILFILVSLILAPAAFAQNYPTRPVHLIVGFGAGSSSDVTGRLIAQKLGELLGQTIRAQYGQGFLDKIELIRTGAKAARRGSAEGAKQLTATLDGLGEDELLPVARAFNQFLNLANIAEQYHRIRRRTPKEPEPFENRVLAELLGRLAEAERFADGEEVLHPSVQGGMDHGALFQIDALKALISFEMVLD